MNFRKPMWSDGLRLFHDPIDPDELQFMCLDGDGDGDGAGAGDGPSPGSPGAEAGADATGPSANSGGVDTNSGTLGHDDTSDDNSLSGIGTGFGGASNGTSADGVGSQEGHIAAALDNVGYSLSPEGVASMTEQTTAQAIASMIPGLTVNQSFTPTGLTNTNASFSVPSAALGLLGTAFGPPGAAFAGGLIGQSISNATDSNIGLTGNTAAAVSDASNVSSALSSLSDAVGAPSTTASSATTASTSPTSAPSNGLTAGPTGGLSNGYNVTSNPTAQTGPFGQTSAPSGGGGSYSYSPANGYQYTLAT